MNESRHIVVMYSRQGSEGALCCSRIPCPEAVSPFLPPDCQLLKKLSSEHIRAVEPADSVIRLRRCFLETGTYTLQNTLRYMRNSGMKPVPGKEGWFTYTGRPALGKQLDDYLEQRSKAPSKAATGKSRSHGAADAFDWDDAVAMKDRLFEDGLYRDSMLVALGIFLGLRVSDLLRLRWEQILSEDSRLTLVEKKTGKKRSLRIHPELRSHALRCFGEMGLDEDLDPGRLVLASWKGDGSVPITRQRAFQVLREAATRYGITSATNVSTHSLRKTFGRRVWLKQCEKGRGEEALFLLGDVFGHSKVSITKRYLGIRQEEILSVYDALTD